MSSRRCHCASLVSCSGLEGHADGGVVVDGIQLAEMVHGGGDGGCHGGARRYVAVDGQAGAAQRAVDRVPGRFKIDVGHGHDGAGTMVGLGALAADPLAAAGQKDDFAG